VSRRQEAVGSEQTAVSRRQEADGTRQVQVTAAGTTAPSAAQSTTPTPASSTGPATAPSSAPATAPGIPAQQRGLSIERGQRTVNEDRSHPFYWASFIQSGDWRSLDGSRQ
jgi:hypothetical protein